MEAFRSAPWQVCSRLEIRDRLLPRRNRIPTHEEKSMGHPAHHHQINYIEFTTPDIARTKAFYSDVFAWQFQDWGPDYIGFSSETSGIDGGFARRTPDDGINHATPLIVLYSADLRATEAAVQHAGGTIVVPIFAFPGGKRFHFSDGAGNILAVWSEKD
jgi:predicted enzyme related to lactoylglutathione lyase